MLQRMLEFSYSFYIFLFNWMDVFDLLPFLPQNKKKSM